MVRHSVTARRPYVSLSLLAVLATTTSCTAADAVPADPVAPANSVIGRGGADVQRLLLSDLESATGITPGGWNLKEAAVAIADAAIGARAGQHALLLRGTAGGAGAKGDFGVAQALPADCRAIGLWFHMPPKANVERAGLQFVDAQGEYLIATRPVEGQGWQWWETGLGPQDATPAFAQPNHNGRIDQPIKSVNVVWFAREAGDTSLGIDGLVAASATAPTAPFTIAAGGQEWGEPNEPYKGHFVVTNYGATPLRATVRFALQHDPQLRDDRPAADAPLPAGADVAAEATVTAEIAPRGFGLVRVPPGAPLGTGAYRAVARLEVGGAAQTIARSYFVMPSATAKLSPDSRFGLNVSTPSFAPLHRRLGIGWVRFENMKWQMISPSADTYRYDGTVGPWYVAHDAIIDAYTRQGLSVLPFLFETASYATSAPESVEPRRRISYPPRDNALYADFVFQTVARYGAAKHPESALKSNDKKSGLNQIHVWELWNEPNLTAPSWGPWVGTSAQYLEMFRAGAEAVKRADPAARVTNGGYAGIDVQTVDELRSYKYADGKRPLDFVDILNVHYYSGQTPPEIATVDTNVDRAKTDGGTRTYEDDLRRLSAWRDQHKPGMPIWLTETGYDTGGPRGLSERLQAARLPRVMMMALAGGMERVMVYREAGSTPGLHAASGLVRNDGTLKPSWLTYATLVRELDGVTGGVRLPHPDPNVRLYRWTRGAETILSAWTVQGTAPLALDLGRCTVTDAFGARHTAEIGKNATLSDFPIYLRDIGRIAPIDALLAQQKAAEAERARRTDRLRNLRAYLYDFGGTERVAVEDIGDARPFTAVLAKDTYDEARGWGFAPRAGLQDGTRTWIDDPRERDSVRINKDVQFRLRAAPGRYRLRVGMGPLAKTGNVVVGGASGGALTLPVTQEAPLAESEVVVGSEPLLIGSDNWADLRWVSLVEVEKE